MRTVITGGAGFLGTRLARVLLDGPDRPGDRADQRQVLLADRLLAGVVGDGSGAGRLGSIELDLTGPQAAIDDVIEGADQVVHLASVVSADAELDPDRAWQVNVEGTRRLLDACSRRPGGRAGRGACRVVAASSVAVFSATAEPSGDGTRARPRSTYGMTKAVLELLVEEATRRGSIDGRVARLPTVIVRPGAPNLAASSFASGVFREPLAGRESVVPVSPTTGLVVIGQRAAVAGLAGLLRAPGEALGADRAVNLPGLCVTVAEMIAVSEAVAAAHGIVAGPITVVPDPAVEAIVGSWPAAWDATRAIELGLAADRSLRDVVEQYVEDAGLAVGSAGRG